MKIQLAKVSPIQAIQVNSWCPQINSIKSMQVEQTMDQLNELSSTTKAKLDQQSMPSCSNTFPGEPHLILLLSPFFLRKLLNWLSRIHPYPLHPFKQ